MFRKRPTAPKPDAEQPAVEAEASR
jgi:hypothetical protein